MRYAKKVNGRRHYPTAAEFAGIPNWEQHDGQLRKHGYLPEDEYESLYQNDLYGDTQEAVAPVAKSGTAVITCHYGGYNELRREATLRAMNAWGEQKYIPRNGVFLELVCPGQSSCFSQDDLPGWLKYIRIYGRERNVNLFQKEALWNIGARLTEAGKLFFLDNDCMPLDNGIYFRQIFDACIPGRCVHAAWHIVHEGQQPRNHDYWSMLSKDEELRGKPRFPGMGYCLTRDDYERMDGFNPFSICGSGDAVFIWESMKSVPQAMTYARRFHEGLIRPHQPQLEPYAVKGLTVQHNFHGMKSDRGYVWSRYAVQLFGHPKSYCHIDQSGLLAWNDPYFPLKDIVMQKSRMHTKQELYELVCEVVKRKLDEMEAQNKRKEDGWDGTAFYEYV